MIEQKVGRLRLRCLIANTGDYYKVMALSTPPGATNGTWKQIGTCHLAAKADVLAGKYELIQFAMEAGQ